MSNSLNVGVGKPRAAGSVYAAPIGTTVPTTASETLDPAFGELGYASDAGLVNSVNETSEDIKAWGGDTVLVVSTDSSETFQITMIETNKNVAVEFFGRDNVTGDDETGLVIISNANEKEIHPWVFETLISTERKQRIVVPRGKVRELGDLTYVDGQPIGYSMTIQALPDEEGNRVYRYTASVDGTETDDGEPKIEASGYLKDGATANETLGVSDAGVGQVFYAKFDKPVEAPGLLFVVEAQGKKYGLIEPNPAGKTKFYFTLQNGVQTDFVDGKKKANNAEGKLDLSSFSGTVTMTVYKTLTAPTTETYPTDIEQIKTESITI